MDQISTAKLIKMKKLILALTLFIFSVTSLRAQDPITEIIKQGIKKVIKAVDLQIQRIQNRTIWLQNVQKTVENAMSELKLTEITDWVEKQRKLYDDYFQELWKVKAVLAYYQRVKDIIKRQELIVKEYKSAWLVFRQDKNFTKEELDFMQIIHKGILEESLKNIDQLFLVINAFATQMSDAKRLEIINTVSNNLEGQWMDLKDFNEQYKMMSIHRASERGEIEYARKLYGL